MLQLTYDSSSNGEEIYLGDRWCLTVQAQILDMVVRLHMLTRHDVREHGKEVYQLGYSCTHVVLRNFVQQGLGGGFLRIVVDIGVEHSGGTL